MGIRDVIARAAAGTCGLLPWRRLSRAMRPAARVRLWRGAALGVSRCFGMRPAEARARACGAGPGAIDVLLVSDALYPERGGGTRSFMRLAQRLAALGRRVVGLCQGPERKLLSVGGVEVRWLSSADELPAVIRELRPRRLFVQQEWAPPAAEAARAQALPYWYFIRSTEELVDDDG
ncbi:MAG: hypothetical protein IT577_07565 [Verrucomicrobiae bacterium]|nr:hypothetical protein [Verrucomicrobiae bacterium]